MSNIKRIVNTSFWEDDMVMNVFSPEDKYFMLYLLTNPYTTQLGIYHLPIKKAAVDLGYTTDSVNVLLDRFENKYHVIKHSKQTNEIAIKNALRHSIVKGGKPVMDCLIKEEHLVKDKSLLEFICRHMMYYINDPRLNITIRDYINNIKDKYINDNDNDNERIVDESYHESWTNREYMPEGHGTSPRGEMSEANDESAAGYNSQASQVKEVIDYLNQVIGSRYRYTDTNAKHIKARLKEGFTVDDFKTVISYKHDEWGSDAKMKQFLRPITLFSTKFESYLQAAPDAYHVSSQEEKADDGIWINGVFYEGVKSHGIR